MNTHGIRPEKLKYLVFAGNFREYRQWMLTKGVLVEQTLFVTSPENLNRVSTADSDLVIAIVGTFHLRSNSQELMDTARKMFPRAVIQKEAITF